MSRATVLLLLLLCSAGVGCSASDAQSLYETAQFEEKQNNVPHAKELYKEITRTYPNSPYAEKAAARLNELSRAKP